MATVATEKNQATSIWRELLAWSLVAGYIVAGLFGLYQLDEQYSAFRLLLSIIGVAALVPMMLLTTHGFKLYNFSLAAWSEIRQVVWPMHDEAVKLTGVVVTAMVIVSLLLWGVDIIIASTFKGLILG